MDHGTGNQVNQGEGQVTDGTILYMTEEANGVVIKKWKITPLPWDAEPLDVMPPYDLLKCSREQIYPEPVPE
jgi:hypothetical protein